MICCAGLSAPLTSSQRARSLTAPTNSLTTGSATSASSSAIRISRAVASMSASESRPLPRRFLKVSARRSESVANTVWVSPSHRWLDQAGSGTTPSLAAEPRSDRLDAPEVAAQPPSAVRTAWAAAAARSSVGRTPPTSWT